jgi:uncharacterized membrane protein YphA (DoxX/SURF4 family)
MKASASCAENCVWGNAAGLLARWILGALFVYMGLNKAVDPVEFLKLVRQYDLTSNHLLLNSIAATLPWFEIFCGALLILGIGVRGAALLLVAMLVPFTIVVAHRAMEISDALKIAYCAVKFDCGCGTGEVLICRKLVENFAMILLSLWLAIKPRGLWLSVRFSLFGPSGIDVGRSPRQTAIAEETR